MILFVFFLIQLNELRRLERLRSVCNSLDDEELRMGGGGTEEFYLHHKMDQKLSSAWGWGSGLTDELSLLWPVLVLAGYFSCSSKVRQSWGGTTSHHLYLGQNRETHGGEMLP